MTRTERRIEKYREIRHGHRRDRLYVLSQMTGPLIGVLLGTIVLNVVLQRLELSSPWNGLLQAAVVLVMAGAFIVLFLVIRSGNQITTEREMKDQRAEIVAELRDLGHDPRTQKRKDQPVCDRCHGTYHRWAVLMGPEEANDAGLISVTRRCEGPYDSEEPT